MNKFNVGDLAVVLPPLECRCAYCMEHVGEIVTITTPLMPADTVNGGVAHGVRFLDGSTRYLRPEMLQKLPPVRDEIEIQETAHV